MKDKLRHGVYFAVAAVTVGPVFLLEKGGKLANWANWMLFDLGNWAFRDIQARAQAARSEERERLPRKEGWK